MVYGGGGISPDEKFTPQKLDGFETELLIRYALSNYTRHFFATHKQKLPADWQVDEATMNDFHNYILDNKLEFTEKPTSPRITTGHADACRPKSTRRHSTSTRAANTRSRPIRKSSRLSMRCRKRQALMSNAKKIIVERMRK